MQMIKKLYAKSEKKMNAIKYIKAKGRMCESFDSGECLKNCPLHGLCSCEDADPETAVAIVKKWAKDHPEKKAKGNEK